MTHLEPRHRWSLLVLALLGLVLFHAWFSQFNHDEIEHLHVAWLIARGQKPYADFIEQHHPVLGYLFSPAVGWFGSVRGLVFAARLFDLGCILACLFSFSRMLRRVYPDVPVRWPLLLLVTSFMFVRSSLEVRPDPLMNALVYAALLHLTAFLQERSPWRALLAGAFLGAAAAVLQKAIVVLALVGGALLLLALLHRRDPVRRNRILLGGAVILGTALLPLAALFAFIRSQGYWQDFWFWNYEFNRYFYTQAALGKHFSVLASVGLSALVNPVLWLAGCSGIVL
jgi:4-amino-4-deoxy-L-arabinose transferase-like glycosyltransferase